MDASAKSPVRAYLFTDGNSRAAAAEVQDRLDRLQAVHPHVLTVVDISKNGYLLEELGEDLPSLDICSYHVKDPSNLRELEAAFELSEKNLQSAQENGQQALVAQLTQPVNLTASDRFTLWFSRHYLKVISLLLLIYLGLPFLAPVLMKNGQTASANVIYKLYRPLCHQLAFRSFFLFGEQAVYPREAAHVHGVIPYGEATGLDEADMHAAANFLGNEQLGYKVALCERDVAIYGALLLFSILCGFLRRKIKPIPWWMWVVFGILPVGLDGGTQLLGQLAARFFSWIPVRESTPTLRVLTGALFGWFTAWFAFPSIEESVQPSRLQVEKKHAILQQGKQ